MDLAYFTAQDYAFVAVRTIIGLFVVYFFGILYGIPLLLVLSTVYGYVIALIFGVHTLSLTDLGMLYENKYSRTTIVGALVYDRFTFKEMQQTCIDKNIKVFPKFREKLVKMFGAYYSKTISVEESLKQLIRVEEDIKTLEDFEKFIASHINLPFELDKPQWKAYFIENYLKDQSIIVYFCQHYVMDGLTATYFICALSDQFDPDSIPQMPKIPFLKKVFMSIMAIYYIPKDLLRYQLARTDVNAVNNGKPLSGLRTIALNKKNISLEEIKKYAKKYSLTVNAYMMGIISQSFHQYFAAKKTNVKDVHVVLPISIRFKDPKKVEDIDMHNLISGIVYELPIIKDMDKDNSIIKKVDSSLKSSYGWFSAIYWGQFCVATIPVPMFYNSIQKIFRKCTLIFSNVIGPRKVQYIRGKPLNQTYALVNGNPGIGFTVLLYSYLDKITFSVTSDTNRMDNAKEFADIIETNIFKYYGDS